MSMSLAESKVHAHAYVNADREPHENSASLPRLITLQLLEDIALNLSPVVAWQRSDEVRCIASHVDAEVEGPELMTVTAMTPRKMALIMFALSFIQAVMAAPQIALPLNAQVPPLAYASMPFQYTFAPSTFSTSFATMNYTFSGGPSWLHFDGPTRTFTGTPSLSDIGAINFDVTATDRVGTTDMAATLIVATKKEALLGRSVVSQLYSYGPNAAPGNLWLYASSDFNIAFTPDTFLGSGMHHYAVSADNTPLPSWVRFDGATLRFHGSTPHLSSLTSPPETFGLKLIASNVVGFGGAAWTFNLIVGAHQLAFDEPEQTVIITRGSPVLIADLSQHLKLDGQPLRTQDIRNVSATGPSWLTFDSSAFLLSGTPPQNYTTDNVTVSVIDNNGDRASTTLQLTMSSSLLTGTLTGFDAKIGQPFVYDISHAGVVPANIDVESSTSPPSPWINFDAQNLRWSGTVPNDTQDGKVIIQLKAISKIGSPTSDTQNFTMKLIASQPAPPPSAPTSTIFSSSANHSPQTGDVQQRREATAHRKLIAAAVVAPIVILTTILIALCCCLYRRRKRRDARTASRTVPSIPRAVPPPEPDWPDGRDSGHVSEEVEKVETVNAVDMAVTVGEVGTVEMVEKVKKISNDKPPRLPRLHTWSVIWTPDPQFRSAQPSPQHLQGQAGSIGVATTDAYDSTRSPLEGFNPSRTATNFSLRTTTTSPAPPIPYKSTARPLSMTGLGLSIPSSQSEMSSGPPISHRISGIGHGSGGFTYSEAGPPGFGIPHRSWRESGRRTWATIHSSEIGSEQGTRSSGMLDQFPMPLGATVRLVTSPGSNLDPTRISASRRERYGDRRAGTSPLFGGSLRPSSRSTARTRPNTRSSIIPPLPYDDSSGMVTVDSFLRSLSGIDSLDTDSAHSYDAESRFRTFGSSLDGSNQWDHETTTSERFRSASEADVSTDAGTEDRFVESVDGEGNRWWRPAVASPHPGPQLMASPEIGRIRGPESMMRSPEGMMRSPEQDSDHGHGEASSEIEFAVPVTMSRTSRPLDLRLHGMGSDRDTSHRGFRESRGSSMSGNPGSPRLVQLRPQRPISIEADVGHRRWMSRSASTAFM